MPSSLQGGRGRGGGLSRFWAIWGENPKNRLWGRVEAVSAKFSGDLKVAHGDSATDEPKKIQILSR